MTMLTQGSSPIEQRRAPRNVFDDDGSSLPQTDPSATPDARSAANLRSLSVWLRCTAYALLIWSTVWIVYPKSYREWSWEAVAILGGPCMSGPLIAAAVSLWVLRRGKPMESPIIHGLLKLSTVILTSIFLPFATLVNGFEANNLLPFFVSLPLLIAMAVVGALRVKLQHRPVDWKHERPLHWLIVASVAGPALGLPLWSVLNIPLVAGRAAWLAGSDAYCLQAPGDHLGRGKTVTSFSQLAGLRMHTPRTNGGGSTDYQFAFHSVLVVRGETENQFYNWSYHELDFVPVSEGTKRGLALTADCEPKPGFLYTLDLF